MEANPNYLLYHLLDRVDFMASLWTKKMECLYANSSFQHTFFHNHQNIVGVELSNIFDQNLVSQIQTHIKMPFKNNPITILFNHVDKDTSITKLEIEIITDIKYENDFCFAIIIKKLNFESKMIVGQTSMTIQDTILNALSTFTSGIAHEINNPLAIITGKTQFMLHKSTSRTLKREEINPGLEIINKNVERAANVILKLREFAKDRTQEITSITTYNKLVSTNLELVEQRIKNHRIFFELKSTDNFNIRCCEMQVAQAIYYIILNAVEALTDSDHSGDHKKILIESKQEGNLGILRIIDNGPGIPNDIVHQIWIPFYSTKRKNYHSGLGLTLAYNNIKQNSGRLYLDRSHNETCFTIELPAEPAIPE